MSIEIWQLDLRKHRNILMASSSVTPFTQAYLVSVAKTNPFEFGELLDAMKDAKKSSLLKQSDKKVE